MTDYDYIVIDRRHGGRFTEGRIRAISRSVARRQILKDARGHQPRDARNYGYVPLRDWRIVFVSERPNDTR